MDIITLALAKNYVTDIINNLPKGIIYRGAVDYLHNLPIHVEIGDAYTVNYQGDSGTISDGNEYVWGVYQNIPQWIQLGPDISQYQLKLTESNQLSSDYVNDEDKEHKFVTQDMYDYLDNITYKAPTVAALNIYNSSNVQLSSSYETGFSVVLGKAAHRETNISNISGNLTLKYQLGSSVVDVSNAVAPSETNQNVEMSDTLTLSNAGTLRFTLSGTNNRGGSFSRNFDVAINDYAYMIASGSNTPPTTGLSRAGVISTFMKDGAKISYNAGQYLYFYILASGGIVEHFALGEWSGVDGFEEVGTYQITKANGITGAYHVYRVGPTLAGLTNDSFRVRVT